MILYFSDNRKRELGKIILPELRGEKKKKKTRKNIKCMLSERNQSEKATYVMTPSIGLKLNSQKSKSCHLVPSLHRK